MCQRSADSSAEANGGRHRGVKLEPDAETAPKAGRARPARLYELRGAVWHRLARVDGWKDLTDLYRPLLIDSRKVSGIVVERDP
jgi:hypothetical protein